jgi:hypothetical protein
VNKRLAGIQAVQMLSRLSRAHPGKDTTYVLDFVNDAEEVLAAFKTYHTTATLSGTTDPNLVFNLSSKLDAANNTKEQFANSPDLKSELLNVIISAGRSHADEHAGAGLSRHHISMNGLSAPVRPSEEFTSAIASGPSTTALLRENPDKHSQLRARIFANGSSVGGASVRGG